MADLTNFTGSVNVQFSWNASQTLDGQQTSVAVPGSYGTKNNWAFGDDVGQAANVFYTVEILLGGQSANIDLFNLIQPQSNLNISFAYGTVVMLGVEILTNDDGSALSSGIRVGGASPNGFDGWLSAGATQDIDVGGLPYVAGGSATLGKTVSAAARYLKILNRDGTNTATVRVTVYGVQNNF